MTDTLVDRFLLGADAGTIREDGGRLGSSASNAACAIRPSASGRP
jgi:hypothetical protein